MSAGKRAYELAKAITEWVNTLFSLGEEIKRMKQAIADLTTAVNANTAAVNAAIAAGIGGTSAADIAAVVAIKDVVAQNTAALVAATPITPVP